MLLRIHPADDSTCLILFNERQTLLSTFTWNVDYIRGPVARTAYTKWQAATPQELFRVLYPEAPDHLLPATAFLAHNKEKFTGTSTSASGKHTAMCGIGPGKSVYLGTYESVILAACAYDDYVINKALPRKRNFSWLPNQRRNTTSLIRLATTDPNQLAYVERLLTYPERT